MPIDIVFRNEKGDELTFEEMDANLANLKVAVEGKKDNFSILPVNQGGTGNTDIDGLKSDLGLTGVNAESLPIIPSEFGAVGDGEFATATGTDNSSAFVACIAEAVASGRPILLDSVYRIADADVLVLTDAVHIYGYGPETGIIVECDATQTSVWIKSAVHLHDFRIHCKPTEAKPADSGQLQACVTIGDGFYLNRDHIEVQDWRVERMRLTRASGVGGGWAFIGIGNVSNGYVGEIDDIGSGESHSGLVAFHWAPRTATGTVGEVPTKTWHPRYISVGSLYAENSAVALSTSACYDIVQNGQVTLIGGSQLYVSLPGDEIDTYSQHPTGSVGKGIRINGPLLAQGVANNTDAVIDLFSVGTSKISTMPDDAGILLQKALDCDISIGDVTVIGSTNANKYLISAYKYTGNLKIGKVVGKDVAAATRGVSISSSIGNIAIDNVECATLRDAIYISSSSGITVNNSKITTSAENGSSDHSAYMFGDTFTATASGVHAEEATKLTLTAGLSDFVLPGRPVKVNGEVVYSTSYAPIGATSLYVTAIPTALAGGETITVDNQCYNLDLCLNIEKGYYGIDCAGSFGVLRGSVNNAFFIGARFRNGAIMELLGMTFSGNGRGRQDAGALATADIQVTNTAARVKMIGGSCGIDGRLTEYNIRCSTSEGTWRRFIGVGVSFAGNVTSHITASTANNWALVGCTDKTGTLI